jgi:hypothetical protein
MKFTQKTKYFIFGAIATAVLVPLGTYAVKTIPVTFAEGDIVSASVMNALMSRINDTQKGYESIDELVGTYSCTTFDNNGHNMCPSGTYVLNNGVYTATQTLTLTKSGNNLTFTGATVAPGGCGHNSLSTPAKTGTLSLSGGTMLANSVTSSWQDIRKLSPTKFKWDSGLPYAFALCELTTTPPSPVDAVTATVSGANVALTWKDQSTDETGFKVQYKTSAKGSWTTATTTAANTTSYTLSSLTAGTYWIRVVAKNTNGDSMSSSEVQAIIQ